MYYPGVHSTSGDISTRSGLTDCRLHTQQRRAIKPLPLLSFSNGKGSTALAQWHLDQRDEQKDKFLIEVLFILRDILVCAYGCMWNKARGSKQMSTSLFGKKTFKAASAL